MSAIDRTLHTVAAADEAPPRVSFSHAERQFILVAGDLLLLNAALLVAVTVWNEFPLSAAAALANAKWFVTLSALWLLIGSVLDIFNPARASSGSAILLSAGVAVVLTAVIYIAIPWLTPPILARSYVFGFALLSVGSILAWRILYGRLIFHSAFQQRAIILGQWQAYDTLVADVARGGEAPNANPFRGTGYEILGYVASEEPAAAAAEPAGSPVVDPAPDSRKPVQVGLSWLGAPVQLVCLARSLGAGEIIVTKELHRLLEPELYDALLDCRELGLRVNPLSEVYERLTARFPVRFARRDPALLFSTPDHPTRRLSDAAKTLFDLLAGLIGLVTLGLVAPWVALANALWARGPLFYRQQRIGQGGKPFVVVKFRSMVPDAERDTGAVWSGHADLRITPVGRWLRRTRLDELPQVINILRGEMSLVGPRPERPEIVGELIRQMPIYRVRHIIKPGITGWAQVRFRYGNTVEDARIKLEYDLYYIKHRGVYLDLLILLQTIMVLLGLKGK